MAALLILLAGGGIYLHLSQQPPDVDTRVQIILCLAVSIIGAGILIIAATANWWLKR
jgi:hypothetical protein